jgi:hypothetical protein
MSIIESKKSTIAEGFRKASEKKWLFLVNGVNIEPKTAQMYHYHPD